MVRRDSTECLGKTAVPPRFKGASEMTVLILGLGAVVFFGFGTLWATNGLKYPPQ